MGNFTPQRVLCGCHGIEIVWLWDVREGKKRWVACYVKKIDGSSAWNGRDKFYETGRHYPHSWLAWKKWRNREVEARDATDYLLELAKNAAK